MHTQISKWHSAALREIKKTYPVGCQSSLYLFIIHRYMAAIMCDKIKKYRKYKTASK